VHCSGSWVQASCACLPFCRTMCIQVQLGLSDQKIRECVESAGPKLSIFHSPERCSPIHTTSGLGVCRHHRGTEVTSRLI